MSRSVDNEISLPRQPVAAKLRFNADEGYRPAYRECDDPRENFKRIRNQKLWDDLERKRSHRASSIQHRAS